MLTEKEFFDALKSMPEPEPIFYRLYYNEQGRPLFYSMEDLEGTYIEVDALTFARSPMNVRVKNGQLVEAVWRTSSKLEPSESGTPCHPDDVAIVVSIDEPHQHWSKRIYESN